MFVSVLEERVNLPQIIGKGYATFWNSKNGTEVVKGGRSSKKSTTAALRMIYRIMYYPLSNGLVIRRFYNTHKDSTFAQLKWATHRLKVSHLWKFSNSPYEATYIPTGQKILFRGFDKPDSITSITVDVGVLCFCWVEEAFQLESEENYNKLEMSIRGEVPPHLFKQITLTFNPWSAKWWGKKRWFNPELPPEDTLVMTTNYLFNEWNDAKDIKKFEDMRIRNPRRYQVEGRGEWGIMDGLIYENWEVKDFDLQKIASDKDVKGNFKFRHRFGMDFGWNNPTTCIACYISPAKREIYVFDELYQSKFTNDQIVTWLKQRKYNQYVIKADAEDPKTIDYLNSKGNRVIRCKKEPGSVLAGIRKLQDYKIYVHPKCTNTTIELASYAWDTTKQGTVKDTPLKQNDHLMDALRYATEDIDISMWAF